jgi:hypothetical protein
MDKPAILKNNSPGIHLIFIFIPADQRRSRAYGKKVNVPRGDWSALRVTAQGKLFTVYFNDQRLYEVEDETFKDAGKVGPWTKCDSVTQFDDLRVIAR